MRYNIFILVILLTIIGCNRDSDIIVPLTAPPSRASNIKDNILYTFAVSKDTLGILDTLDMTMTALNQTTSPDTILISDNYYNWSLTNENGKIISSGPTVFSNLIRIVLLNPHQSLLLYHLKLSMADIFGAPIQEGSYQLRWNLINGLSFKINLLCGMSNNEITDSSGITSPIYPLKVGNKWTFKKTYYFTDGTVLGSDTVTQTIVGETIINGEKWFLVISTNYVDQLLTARQDGIYSYNSDFKVAVLKYKYPATMGEEYASEYEEWTGSADTLVPFQMTVDSTNEIVSVPFGQYQCYKYHAPEVIAKFGNETNEIGSQDILLSNVGPVKEIFGNIIWELVSTNF